MAHSPDKFGWAGRTETKEASSGQNCKPLTSRGAGSVSFEGDSATNFVYWSARSHPSSTLTLPESSSWKSSSFAAWVRFPAGTWSRQPPTHLQALRHGHTGCGCRICLKAGYHTGSGLAPPGTAKPLMWSNKSSSSCILRVKNLLWTKTMLDKLFVSWMLQRVFHTSECPLQFLMCASWLFAKLRMIMDMVILTHFWNYFNTFGSTLKNWTFSDMSTMSQWSIEAKTISNLNF